MLTGELKSRVDKVWETFWTGGVTDPLTVIKQMTYLLFLKRLDDLQTNLEKRAQTTGKPIENPIYAPEQKHLRWGSLKQMTDPEAMFNLFRKEGGAFDFMRTLGNGNAAYARFMKEATLVISKPALLESVVQMLDAIPMDSRDVKGDLYEYLLSKIATAGRNGQFRTPRHIIRMMVEMVEPGLEDTIADPAAGTCGFLVGAAEYLQDRYADELTKKAVLKRFQTEMFHGMEFDASMLGIGAMNMLLHGIESPNLIDRDALSKDAAGFDQVVNVIFANPPFKGSLDVGAVDEKVLALVNSKKTELLFLGRILRGLKVGGRAAVIVPDGVLFGSSKAHKQIRQELVDNQHLQGVVSMPAGVFKPYAGVSTAVLLFTRTDGPGNTKEVWFYDMQADGFSLDDKRAPVAENNIPDVVARYRAYKTDPAAERKRARTERSFVVPLAEIRDHNHDLSINRYKQAVHAAQHHEPPTEIIARIEALDTERAALLADLKLLLK